MDIGGCDGDGVTSGFDFSRDAEPFCQHRDFHLTAISKAFFVKPILAQCSNGSKLNDAATAEGQEDGEAMESEPEAKSPTKAAQREPKPENHGDDKHSRNMFHKIIKGSSSENRSKKITSTNLGQFLLEKNPGWDFGGKSVKRYPVEFRRR